ncbi:MAG: O-antigen ligase family protein [Planctomycetota bacterium]
METTLLPTLRRVIARVVQLLLVAVPLLAVCFTDPESAGVGFVLVKLLMIITVVLGLAHWVLGGPGAVFMLHPAAAALLAFGGLAWAALPGRAVLSYGVETARWSLIAAAYGAMAIHWAGDGRVRRSLAAALIAGGLALAVFGLDQHFFQFDRLVDQVEADPERYLAGLAAAHRAAYLARLHSREVFATFAHPNSYGALMAVLAAGAGVIAVAAWRSRAGWLRVLAPVLAALAGAAGLAVSRSKGAAAALAAAGLYLLVCHTRLSGRLKAAAVAGAVAAVAAAVLCTSVLDASIAVRKGYWQAAWAMIADHPWRGVGPGNFGHYYPQYKTIAATEVRYPHNIYLQHWSEMGLMAAAAFAVAGLLVIIVRRRLADPVPEPGPAPLTAWPWVATAAAGVLCVAGIFGVFRECSAAGTVLIILAVLTAPGWYALIDARLLPAAAVMGAGAAALLLAHAVVDSDLAVPGIMVIFLTAAAPAAGGTRGRAIPARPAVVPVIAACIIAGAYVYAAWGLADFNRRLLENEIQFTEGRGQAAESLALADRAAARYPEYERFVEYGVRLRRAAGGTSLAAAITAQRALAERAGNRVCDWSLLADLLREARRWDAAAAAFRRAAELYPLNPRYLLGLSDVLSSGSETVPAADAAGAALRLDDRVIDPNVRLEPDERVRLAGRAGTP